jgi:hypothetical protein
MTKNYEANGITEFTRKNSIPKIHPKQLPQNVIKKIIELRNILAPGSQRITWYLKRFHGIITSCSTIYRTLARNGMSKVPKTAPCKAINTKRYNNTVSDDDTQIDVTFIRLKTDSGTRIRRSICSNR